MTHPTTESNVTTSLAKEYLDFLKPKIDLYDWGAYPRKQRMARANTSEVMDMMLLGKCRDAKWYPQRLTRKIIASHLAGTDRVAASPSRRADIVMVLVDVDAHNGQTDAAAAAAWLWRNHFNGCYVELSPRGVHLHVLVNVAGITRSEFNARIRAMQSHFQSALREAGYQSTVEILGRFTLLENRQIKLRGDLAALPRLPRGIDDLDRLKRSPIFKASMPGETEKASKLLSTKSGVFKLKTACDTQSYVLSIPSGAMVNVESAWDRMRAAAYLMVSGNRAIPTVDDLLNFYRAHWFAGSDHPQRIKRAKQVVAYLHRRFKSGISVAGSYEACATRLKIAVATHCTDRRNREGRTITDNDLTVALYLVTRSSFTNLHDPRRQWTVPITAFTGMFRSLKSAGVIKSGGCRRNKIVALKSILVRAGLIECIDEGYVPAGRQSGIGKKYTIGVKHPRFAQFCRFAETVSVKYVGGPLVEAKSSAVSTDEIKKIGASAA